MNNGNGRQRPRGKAIVKTAVAAIVIAAVLILNIAVSALVSGNLWYLDVTPDAGYNVYEGTTTVRKHAKMYTLMEETVDYVDYVIDTANARRPAGEPVKVDIIFCADPDILRANAMMRYVYYTALSLAKEFPETISVSYRDVWNNPSSVDEFRSTAYANIYQTNVIVSSGTEYRIGSLRSFYAYDTETDMSTPVAYNGQKVFAQQILDVTGAESPIVCLTTNHGEVFGREGYELSRRDSWPEYKEFLNVLEGAGYEVRYLDLYRDEIPENCRLILSFDPQTDFSSSYASGNTQVSEILKLDAFLDKAYSFMVFTDADTPSLPNLEEYLEFWGIEMMRYEGKDAAGERVSAGYRVQDYDNRLDGTGTIFSAEYAKGLGLGNAVIADILDSSANPKIIFSDARPLRFATTFENRYVMADPTTGAEAYSYAFSEKDGTVRAAFDMFHAGDDDAEAEIYAVRDGETVTDASGNPIGGMGSYHVMTMSAQSRRQGEGMGYSNIDKTTYVCVAGSTEMVSDAILGTTSYGNTDMLLSTLRYIGKDVNPVGLPLIPMQDPEIDLTVSDASGAEYALFTEADLTGITVALTAIPAAITLLAGAIVLIRRRVRS